MKGRNDAVDELLKSLLELSLYNTPLEFEFQRDAGGYIFIITLPGEMSCRFRILDDCSAVDRAMEAVGAVRTFLLYDYSEAMLMTAEAARRFLSLPGDVQFLNEDERHVQQHRLSLIAAQDIFGASNVRGADYLTPDTLSLHTREGDFHVNVNRFKYSLQDTLNIMSRFMRKPLRKRYDKENATRRNQTKDKDTSL